MIFMSQNDTSIKDDPVRAPLNVTKCPIQYRISLGTCQRKAFDISTKA